MDFVSWGVFVVVVVCLVGFPMLKESRGRAELRFFEEFCSLPLLSLPGLPIPCSSEILYGTKGGKSSSVPLSCFCSILPMFTDLVSEPFCSLSLLSLRTHSAHGWLCITVSTLFRYHCHLPCFWHLLGCQGMWMVYMKRPDFGDWQNRDYLLAVQFCQLCDSEQDQIKVLVSNIIILHGFCED